MLTCTLLGRGWLSFLWAVSLPSPLHLLGKFLCLLETPEKLQFREFSCSFARTVKGIPRVVCSTLHVEALGWKWLCAQETSLTGSSGTKLSGVPILWEKVFLLLIGVTFLDVGCPKLIANMFIDPF